MKVSTPRAQIPLYRPSPGVHSKYLIQNPFAICQRSQIAEFRHEAARKVISVVTPCYNEEANGSEVCTRVKAIFESDLRYDYEHIFIDNASQDSTLAILKEIAHRDPRVKVTVNARNFGHLRSPMHGMLQAGGDAVVLLFADLQDPPELLRKMIEE
jgi:glycosyltransferase involved in cell wall biosynthesis